MGLAVKRRHGAYECISASRMGGSGAAQPAQYSPCSLSAAVVVRPPVADNNDDDDDRPVLLLLLLLLDDDAEEEEEDRLLLLLLPVVVVVVGGGANRPPVCDSTCHRPTANAADAADDEAEEDGDGAE